MHLFGAASFGEEGYEAEIRLLAIELGVADRVIFHGHVDDVQASLESMDVCVQSSMRPEPLGQNVLQYLALGKVTIAADAGGPADYVEHDVNGLLFEMGSLASLEDALRRVESGTLRSRLARRAKNTPPLTDAEIAEMHAEIFRRVAS